MIGLRRAELINAYLVDAPVVFIESRKEPLDDIPEMSAGNRPADGGHLILDEQEYAALIAAEPGVGPYIKELVSADEFINGMHRYCLWFADVTGAEAVIRKLPLTLKRIKACRDNRLKGAPDRQKLAVAHGCSGKQPILTLILLFPTPHLKEGNISLWALLMDEAYLQTHCPLSQMLRFSTLPY